MGRSAWLLLRWFRSYSAFIGVRRFFEVGIA
jgi:hypothetical protein